MQCNGGGGGGENDGGGGVFNFFVVERNVGGFFVVRVWEMTNFHACCWCGVWNGICKEKKEEEVVRMNVH